MEKKFQPDIGVFPNDGIDLNNNKNSFHDVIYHKYLL